MKSIHFPDRGDELIAVGGVSLDGKDGAGPGVEHHQRWVFVADEDATQSEGLRRRQDDRLGCAQTEQSPSHGECEDDEELNQHLGEEI